MIVLPSSMLFSSHSKNGDDNEDDRDVFEECRWSCVETLVPFIE